MAKQKFTEEEARDLLISMNPLRLGVNANPLVEKKNQFILTGVRRTIKGVPNVEVFVQVSTLSDAAKKANPSLVAGRYIRMTKTDMVKEVTSATDDLRAGRKPIADNLFENQNPNLFSTLLKMLQEKDEKGNYTYFTKMPDDKNGLPVLKLKNPVPGTFVTLNMPAHYRITPAGTILAGARKNIRTGAFEDAQNIVFHDMTIFLLPEEFERLEAIALNKFQKLVEPMLAEEVIKVTRVAGKEIKKEIKANTDTAADLEKENADNESSAGEPEFDEMGNPI